VLSGCSSASTPPADPDTGSTSRFTTLFSGSPSPAAQTVAGSPGFNADDCPNVDVRNGAGALTMSGKPPADASTDVRYQLNITQVARQCSSSGGNLVMKVGVQGRIIVGPIGGSGQVDIPLRYAVVREGVTPKTIATKFKRVPADVPSGQSNVGFSDVEESLSFPIPSRAELPAYMVYVGFDEIGDGPEKKPAAKKPAPKKPVPKSQ
jgi:putative transposon-encoded protein